MCAHRPAPLSPRPCLVFGPPLTLADDRPPKCTPVPPITPSYQQPHTVGRVCALRDEHGGPIEAGGWRRVV
ncbi:hypothetical protein BDW22DRAFT_1361815 [Trametopsis cervina]|nr:hypothetical protein BDW22DRAFT_1361815 [Trametopsis cervina]